MKMVRIALCLVLLIGSLLAICPAGSALAQEGEEENKEEIEVSAVYPKVEAIAGEDFVFEVEYKYSGGTDPRAFELRTTVPKGWEAYITPQWEKEKKISALRLNPGFSFGDKTRLVVSAPFYPLPEPGEYPVTLEVSSDDLKATAELTAVITARYNLLIAPASGLYNMDAKSGKDNIYSIEIGNLGTAPIDNIKFSPTKPEGWTVDFTPEKIDLLEAFDSQVVDVNIKPPQDSIAGDYQIKLRASGEQASTEEMTIRVTVESPPTWQWVGVAIIVIVIAALIFIFMRFSRR
jgi:uncharacterized membrane protein